MIRDDNYQAKGFMYMYYASFKGQDTDISKDLDKLNFNFISYKHLDDILNIDWRIVSGIRGQRWMDGWADRWIHKCMDGWTCPNPQKKVFL